MNIDYSTLYKIWETRTVPSAPTARMTRRTLEYLSTGIGAADWGKVPVLPLESALVALNGALDQVQLSSQSRSNYRGYLRRLCRFAVDEGIDTTGNGDGQFWPQIPKKSRLSRREQVTFERFVNWAIGHRIYPTTVKPNDVRQWALDERRASNQHWRKDYERLQTAWGYLSQTDVSPAVQFSALPARMNERFALPFENWPDHLQTEWERMRWAASAPLRKGGMRAWRPVTRRVYQKRLCRFLGWLCREYPDADLAVETWASPLSPDRCRDYLNWLVLRSGKDHLNPGHPAFLRMVRGFHRFLLGSDRTTIDAFHELTRRCDVQERDKAARVVPFIDLQLGLRKARESVLAAQKSKSCRENGAGRLAALQVDAIILGLLTTRGLRSRNIRGIRIGVNLMESGDTLVLKFSAAEMKGHRAFETTAPDDLSALIRDYLHKGFAALAGRPPAQGDHALLTRKGTPFSSGSFGKRVRRIARTYVGRRLNPHLFRHILATHAAQVLKLTPTELAALLAHRSPMTVMKYYEVTNPTLAAERFDVLRNGQAD